MIIPALFVWIDFTILKTNVSEYSLTEITQEFLLLTTSIILYVRLYNSKEDKAFLILLAGLFMAMFIREGDYYWDKIMTSLWTILAFCTFLISVYFAYKKRETIIPTLSTYINTRWFGYLIIGLMIVLLKSRVFGTGGIWRAILQENYNPHFKTAIQEGLELFGYGIIFYGIVLMSRSSLIGAKIKS